MKLYAVFQAQELGKQGIGLKYAAGHYGALIVFPSEMEAQDWLTRAKMIFTMEQMQGIRTADNFNPETGLDFFIGEIDWQPSVSSIEKMKEKGWSLEAASSFQAGIQEKTGDFDIIKNINDNITAWEKHQQATSDKEQQKKFFNL